METIKKMKMIKLTILIGMSLIFQLAHAEVLKWADDKGTIHLTQNYKTTLKKYSQNPEREYWEELRGANFPLTLINWRLATNPGSSDKYMDKHIIGTVKNNSEKEFSEVKIEFTIYDEEGAQTAIVFSNFYDFIPGGIWKFEILVTDDVEKAELKGLYVPTIELKKLENEQKTKGKEGL